eukprot:CAMPEP_0116140884 /NCGR_PEP_ID=MMETSP0329-20121206/14091_1 /TAXON_ID=697910 /ORGANISM="Pseudo-nitzschia arenysensis, Strain B593" /LENGTH=423 /DNA_ID=CAMNT_0003636039 /DNA_START=103 /DNA_END=1374 /DNA_ORIENTATION=+
MTVLLHRLTSILVIVVGYSFQCVESWKVTVCNKRARADSDNYLNCRWATQESATTCTTVCSLKPKETMGDDECVQEIHWNNLQSTTTSTASTMTTTTTTATRRGVLATTAAAAAAATTTAATVASLLLFPQSTIAAEPVNAKDTDSLLAMAKRKLRPKPPKLLRRKLSQDFAVLLMRSSYNALDDIDCVAMDQFQRDFFLIRLAEYQTYTQQLGDGMVQQGDLTDPYYFDFISFAQYKTINREVTQDPPYVFEEQQIPPENSEIPSQNENGTARFIPVVVQRDPQLTNTLLIPTHSQMVGASILDKLLATFGETELKIPDVVPNPDPSTTLLAGIKAIVNIFLVSGYAFRGEVVSLTPNTYKISLNAPATLWSGKILQQEGDLLDNDFLCKTLQEYIRRCGYEVQKSTIKYEGNDEELTISLR